MPAAFAPHAPSLPLRGCVALWLASLFGIFTFAAAKGLGAPFWVAGLVAASMVLGIARILWSGRILRLTGQGQPRFLIVLFGLGAISSVAQLTRLCVFVVNPAAVGYALDSHRGIGLAPKHACLIAYYVAAQAVSTVPNVYDEYRLYSLPVADPTAPRKPRTLGQFDIDAFEYPPAFLLLPRLLTVAAHPFLQFRMLWFALNGSLVLIGLLAVTRMFTATVGTRLLFLSPLVLGSDNVIGTLQIGNIQAAVIAAAMIAMVLFARRHAATGGVLLAFATISKLFPGMLLVYLALQRKWRPVLLTVGACILFVAVSFLDIGTLPHRAFLHHVPRLMSGEAFPVFRRPGGSAANLSVPGFLFKLKLFGLPNGSFEGMKIVGTIYTVVVLAATAVLARRKLEPEEQPVLWLAILILASFRSPFLPPYGLFPVLWLLILLTATAALSARSLCLMLIAWLALNIALPANAANPRVTAASALVSQTITLALLVIAFTRRKSRDTARESEGGDHLHSALPASAPSWTPATLTK